MKSTISKIAMLLTGLVFVLASCSSDDTDNSEQMTNYVSLTINGESAINEDNTDGVEITVSMAYTLDTDATINLQLTGDDANAVHLSANSVTIPAGQKTATVKVLSNNSNVLGAQEVVTVKAISFSHAKMAAIDADGVSVTIKPNTSVPELTAEQLQLIEGYKNNLGIDLTKFLGVLDVTTTITYGNDDKDGENGGEDTKTYNGTSVLTLSQYATADQPVLKIISNPLGMESYMYDRLLRCTTEEPDGYFSGDPISAALTEAVGYDKSKESFSVILDSIRVNANDKTLSFLATQADEYGDAVQKVPFQYTYSVWTRLNEMAAAGKTVQVDEGDNKVEYTISELLEQYNTFNPAKYLGNSDESTDAYGASPSNFITPTATFDTTNGTMTFNFSWDYGAGSYLYDYVRVNVTYTLHK